MTDFVIVSFLLYLFNNGVSQHQRLNEKFSFGLHFDFFRERKENDKKKKFVFFFFVSFFKGKKILPLTHLNIFLFVRKHTHIVNRIKDDVEREREDLYCVWYYYEEVVVRK